MICDNLVKIWAKNVVEDGDDWFFYTEHDIAVGDTRLCQGCLDMLCPTGNCIDCDLWMLT